VYDREQADALSLAKTLRNLHELFDGHSPDVSLLKKASCQGFSDPFLTSHHRLQELVDCSRMPIARASALVGMSAHF